MSDDIIKIDFPVIPVAKARPRIGKNGAYTPKKTFNYEMQLALYARRAMSKSQPLRCPLRVTLKFYVPIPMSKPKIWQRFAHEQDIYPTGKPDIDNYQKALIDACNGIVWEDDALITDCIVSKRYRYEGGIEMTVEPLRSLLHTITAKVLRVLKGVK